MRVRAPTFAALLLALACVGCKRGGANAADAGTSLVATEAWLKGELPQDVLEGTPTDGGTLVVRAWVEPAGLNRLHDRMVEGGMVRYTTGTIFETLFELDRSTHPRYELKPLLAESYTESEDRLTQTFVLRKGVTFHNGEPFTSKDVKAVMDAVMNPKNATVQSRSGYVDLAGYSAPDDHTFVLRWKRPYYLGFRSFAAHLPIHPASALKGDFDTLAINRAPIGTGPFKFESWEPGKALTFVRNERYWGTPAHLDKLVFRYVKDHTVAAQLFERGEFDLMTQIQPLVWKSLEAPEERNAWALRGYHRIKFFPNSYGFVMWNQERPLFKDRDVRRALGMLYPYERISKTVDMGLEVRTTCPFYREGPNCDPTVQPLPYDPVAARKLLESKGWKDSDADGVLDKDGRPFKFTFLIIAQSVKLTKVAPILQEEFRRVGLELDIEAVDAAIYTSRLLKHDFDMGMLIWGAADVEQDQFQVYHSSQSQGSNYVSYSNPEVDRLIEEVRGEFDPARRTELNRRMHRLLYEDQPYTYLTVRPDLDAVKTHVKGIRPALNSYDYRKIWLQPVKR